MAPAVARDRTREFRSALHLELRRAGRPADVERPPVGIDSETLSRAAEVSTKLTEIEALVRRLEALVGLRGETSAAQSQFEVVMESVADDCKWVDRALQRATRAAETERGQRREFERNISLSLRKRLEAQAKKVQACADLRQKTLQDQRQRRNRLSHGGLAISARVHLDTPLFAPPRPPPQAQQDPPPAPLGLRSRRVNPPVTHHPAAGNSRFELQRHQQKQQQQQLLLEQTSRRRMEHAQTIEAEIGKLGDMFSRFSSLVAQQAEVVERLDDDVENAYGEVQAGHTELLTAQSIIKGNRSLLIKVFVLIIVFIVLFVPRRGR